MSNPRGENMRMMQSYTPRDWALLILRVGLGITLIVHGLPKFSGAGPVAFARYLRVHHFPAPLFSAWIMAVVELVGGIAMVAGIQTTYVGWAAAVERVFVVWLLKIAGHVRFVSARGTGWELDFLLFCMAVAVGLVGGGADTPEKVVRSRRATGVTGSDKDRKRGREGKRGDIGGRRISYKKKTKT